MLYYTKLTENTRDIPQLRT